VLRTDRTPFHTIIPIDTAQQVDFLQWKSDANIREVKILRRYHIQDREDYVK
jgi:hypothetical protein